MIDIHTHILPNMDDGATSVEVSAELLQIEAEQGVREIVLSSHYYGKNTAEEFIRLRQDALNKIQAVIPDGIKVRLGAEVLMTGINDPSDETLCALAIEGTKCVLLEFPFTLRWSPLLFERVSDFIAETGYTPIIAHTERYLEVMKNPSLVTQFVQMGCLIQLNSCAFIEKRTRRLALALVKHGLVHCLGTDAHDVENRAPDYVEAKKVLEEKGFAADFERIQENMRLILENEKIDIPEYRPLKKILGFYI